MSRVGFVTRICVNLVFMYWSSFYPHVILASNSSSPCLSTQLTLIPDSKVENCCRLVDPGGGLSYECNNFGRRQQRSVRERHQLQHHARRIEPGYLVRQDILFSNKRGRKEGSREHITDNKVRATKRKKSGVRGIKNQTDRLVACADGPNRHTEQTTCCWVVGVANT